ncbi:hypothetical protein PYCC9005_004364 [Savitreella phatthalungensis]
MPPIDTFTRKLQSDGPYEAHQFLRTAANRLVKTKKYNDALTLLHAAAIALFQRGEGASGIDLAIYAIEVLDADGKTPGDQVSVTVNPAGTTSSARQIPTRDFALELLTACPQSEITRTRLVKKIISWQKSSSTAADPEWGDAEMQERLGDLLASEGDVAGAERHLLLAGTETSQKKLVDILYSWYASLDPTQQSPSNAAAILGRIVLPFLTADRPREALDCARQFVSSLAAVQASGDVETVAIDAGSVEEGKVMIVKTMPLVNFLSWLAVLCVRARNKVELYARLRNAYKATLEADQELDNAWRDALADIALKYFGIRPQRSNNMLAEMMGSLFGGGGGGAGGQQRQQPQIDSAGLD